jgi:hypothetical protein
VKSVELLTNARPEKKPPVEFTVVASVYSKVGLTPTSAFVNWACARPAATKPAMAKQMV